MARRPSPTSIELFTGAGGLALGVAQAGFDHLAVVEWNRDACASLRENQRQIRVMADWPIFERDVRQIDYRPYADRVDLLAAGAPCQPFSLAGKHVGHRDERNMFPEVFRAVRELRPRAVIVENVKGLLRHTFREYFDYILLQLAYPDVLPKRAADWPQHKLRLQRLKAKGAQAGGLAYAVEFQLRNAADFGVPQRRERVFIVAFRSDLGIRWPGIAATHSEDALLYEQWVSKEYWEEHGLRPRQPPPRLASRIERLWSEGHPPLHQRWRTVRDALAGLPEPRGGVEHSTILNHIGNPGARSYPGHTGSPYDYPAKTLKAGDHGVPGGENMLRRDNGAVRYFTVREAARLQTFPDAYAFSGAWCEGFRQLGNAVPVDLARAVAQSVAYQLAAKPSVVKIA